MKKLFILSSVALINVPLYAKCVPAKLTVDYPDELDNVGMYHRVHPSGKYLIASAAVPGRAEARVAIIDLTGKDKEGKPLARAIKTPLIDETYPVEGSWTLLASPRNFVGATGMRYYRFEDVLKDQQEAKEVFHDPNHSQWYHSSAELPGSRPDEMRFRTMLYGESYRDYVLKIDKNGKVTDSKVSETKSACQNITPNLDSPILSKDGTEVAASIRGSTVILKIKSDSTCEMVDNLGFYTSKVNFSYPKEGSKGKIVYVADTRVVESNRVRALKGIFIYDRDTNSVKRLNTEDETGMAYPGMTQDGRVIYNDTKNRQIVIVDPNQLDENGRVASQESSCIQEENSQERPGSGTRNQRSSRQ